MSDNDIAPQEAQNPETDAEVEQILSEADPEETEIQGEEEPDTAALIARKDSIIRQLAARLRKEKGTKPAERQAISPKTDDGDIRSTVQRLALAEEKRQFGFRHSLSPDETDYIFRFDPKPTKELLDDPFVKGGLKTIRDKRRAESNTPPLAGRSPSFALPKKEDLTPDDKQAAFDKFRESRLRK